MLIKVPNPKTMAILAVLCWVVTALAFIVAGAIALDRNSGIVMAMSLAGPITIGSALWVKRHTPNPFYYVLPSITIYLGIVMVVSVAIMHISSGLGAYLTTMELQYVSAVSSVILGSLLLHLLLRLWRKK